MAALTKTFNNVKLHVTFDSSIDPTDISQVPLSSNENLATSLAKIDSWYDLGFGIDIQPSDLDGHFKWRALSKSSTYVDVEVTNVATLDANGKVKKEQLPSFVDDIYEGILKESGTTQTFYRCPGEEPPDWSTTYTSYYTYDSETGTFTPVTGSTPPTWEPKTYYIPIEGEHGKIYVDIINDKQYRWSGTQYTEISSGSDQHVDMEYDNVNKAYLLGTKTSPVSGQTKNVTSVGDTQVYLDTTTHKIVAPGFIGDGSELTNILAEELKNALSFKINNTSFKSFDGGEATTIDFTAGNGITLVKGTATGDLDKLIVAAKQMVGITYTNNAYVAGEAGIVPAPPTSSGNQSYVKTTASGYTGECTQNAIGANGFLRSDGVWSNEPVIENDELVLNCIAG